MAISMLKIRRPLGRLIFNMGIAIPGKTVFLIETAPRALIQYKDAILPQYRKSHCGDKTVVRSSYLHNGISYTGKMRSLYWISPQIEIVSLCILFSALVDNNICRNVMTFRDKWHVDTQISVSTRAIASTQITFVYWQHISTCHDS